MHAASSTFMGRAAFMAPAIHRRRQLRSIAAIGIFLQLAPAAAADVSIAFADAACGDPMADFEFAVTGRGRPGHWQVVADDNARDGKALAQLDKDTIRDRFPLAIYRRINAADVEITAWFQPIFGSSDRVAGVVARFIDANNYYLARTDAIEHNVSL